MIQDGVYEAVRSFGSPRIGAQVCRQRQFRASRPLEHGKNALQGVATGVIHGDTSPQNAAL